MARIAEEWDTFRPTVAFYEGPDRGHADSTAETVAAGASRRSCGTWRTAMGLRSSHFRNVHMFRVLAGAALRSERVLAVVGRNHVPTQTPALRCGLAQGPTGAGSDVARIALSNQLQYNYLQYRRALHTFPIVALRDTLEPAYSE